MTSTLVFENRVTEVGTQAIGDLVNLLARELDQATQIHGEKSREAAESLLALSSVNQIMEPLEEAHASIQRYLATSEEIYGSHSVEVAAGYLLLGWSHGGLGRHKEAKLAIERSFKSPGGRRDFPPVEPLMEALWSLFEKLREKPGPENAQHAFVLGVHMLSWLVTYCPMASPSLLLYSDRLRTAFESWGYRNDVWEWLMRRCNRVNSHFVGLISVLLEEKIVTIGSKESGNFYESDLDENYLMKGYEISGFKREHWTSEEGFSKAFPITVAEGELSLRVDRLLAEGCRYLRSTGVLGTAFLIFSPHLVGRRITAFGTTTWSKEEEALSTKQVRETIAEHGADSAMMLGWVDLPHSEAAESDEVPTEAVLVVARDAKSYFRGLQPARKVDGKYVFDEPMVTVTEDDWFSEFTFPVQPAGKET